MAEPGLSRWRRKAHLRPLFHVALLVIGSSFWLKLSLRGDHSGALIRAPPWVEGGYGDDRAVITNFSMTVHWDECTFQEQTQLPQTGGTSLGPGCGPDEAQIPVEAEIGTPTNDIMCVRIP